ncbi:MAG: tRNA (adenosine(37)-N6)-dimethylallyltransferase MiaA [Phycisphaeraceae bacterium]|nr:tRNA (adenosine(37)-N6)-dimethylallyltransferase MiaA [Phycisphaeraceae bacterium]
MPDRPLIPVIAGPTASGKTALAVACAKVAQQRGLVAAGAAGVVSADAFQVYRGLDIATGKPTPVERQGVEHFLIDILEPDDAGGAFSVARWLERATQAVAQIEGRDGWPIVAGGTHLYIKALFDGLFEGPAADEALRAQLSAMPADLLRAELERVDPIAAGRIHPADKRRTIRAVEVYRLTGRPISEHQAQWDASGPGGHPLADRLLLVTLLSDTPSTNHRINARVRAMVEAGLVEETRGLHEAGRLGPQASQALGTKQILEHLDSGFSLEDAVERIKIETRRFAKNQRTWLRRLAATPRTQPMSLRFDPQSATVHDMAQAIVRQCFRLDSGPTTNSLSTP